MTLLGLLFIAKDLNTKHTRESYLCRRFNALQVLKGGMEKPHLKQMTVQGEKREVRKGRIVPMFNSNLKKGSSQSSYSCLHINWLLPVFLLWPSLRFAENPTS